MRELEGKVRGEGLRVAIVVSRFNRTVTGGLLDGALEALRAHGVAEDAIDVLHVPGAFEITIAASEAARTGRYAAVVCLGAVVRVTAGDRVFTQVHDGKSGYLSQSSLPLYFGLDDAPAVDRVSVQWLGGGEQVLEGPIDANQRLLVVED